MKMKIKMKMKENCERLFSLFVAVQPFNGRLINRAYWRSKTTLSQLLQHLQKQTKTRFSVKSEKIIQKRTQFEQRKDFLSKVDKIGRKRTQSENVETSGRNQTKWQHCHSCCNICRKKQRIYFLSKVDRIEQKCTQSGKCGQKWT